MPRPLSVLVIEDEKILAYSIARFLRRQGFETEVCHDGHSALRKAQETICDVAVTDWGIPGLAGGALLEGLRAANRDCRVIVVSADISVPDTHNTIRAAGIPFLPKPYDLNVLVRHIRGDSLAPAPNA